MIAMKTKHHKALWVAGAAKFAFAAWNMNQVRRVR